MSAIKKLLLSVLSILLSFSAIGFTQGWASSMPSPTSFNFYIGANQSNTRSQYPEYRATSNTNNKWGVAMTDSSEKGGKTYTDFWLERHDGTNVSNFSRVLEQGGTFTNTAYSSASFTSVYLTAENNNYSNSAYNVSGKWRPYGY